MKTVKILGDTLNKVADTSTVFDFRLWNEGQAQDVTGKAVSFTIANDSGYLFDVPAVIDGNVVSLDFSNELLKQLTPDTYHMEVSVTNSDGDVEVYPSQGTIDFRVGKNLHSTQGKLVPQITFDTVLRSVDEKMYVVVNKKTVGQHVTVSFWAKASVNGAKFHSEPQGGANEFNPNLSTDWVRYSYTISSFSGTIYFMAVDAGTTYYIDDLKLEVGNVATDWSSAPEDAPSNDLQLVHNTGNEVLAGDKTFTGNTTLASTTILAGNYGLRVTPSGFQKTTDGRTWVSANI